MNNNNYTINRRPHFTFANAIKAFFKNYAKFDGRASRSEYWWVALASGLISLLFTIPMLTAGIKWNDDIKDDDNMYSHMNAFGYGMMGLIILFGLITFIPSLALNIRRLHDTNKSGWWFLISFIPYVGSLIMLVFMAFDSKPEGARYDGPVQPWAPYDANNNTQMNNNMGGGDYIVNDSQYNNTPYVGNTTNNNVNAPYRNADDHEFDLNK